MLLGAITPDIPLKGPIIEWLRATGHTVEDLGTYSVEPVDFPGIAFAVCDAVREGQAERGIRVCGTVLARVLQQIKSMVFAQRFAMTPIQRVNVSNMTMSMSCAWGECL